MYILFTQKQHDGINFSFNDSVIERVISMWHDDYSNSKICQVLKISHVELALIVMDLDYLGKLHKRRNGLLGTH